MNTGVYVALDLETTGLKPDTDEIVEIAAVRFQGDRTLATWHSLVKPGRALPLRTQVITGITQADVNAAPPFERLLPALAKFLGDAPIVAQSVAVDVGFLAQNGLKLTNPLYDTFELASILLPELADYTLAAIANHLGVPFTGQHRALPDAQATRTVFLGLYRRAFDLDLPILAEIVRLASRFDWPLRHFFRDVERAKGRGAFGGTVGSQLAAKMSLESLNVDLLTKGPPRDEPLVPRGEPEPIDANEIASFLEPGGELARQFAGFEHRPEQVRMARTIARALNEGHHLLVEAPTGVGKSVAYLLPALRYGQQNSARIVVSTNTINLQEQIVGKDVPDIQQALERSCAGCGNLRTALVKGRSNYLCLRRWAALRRADNLTLDEAKVLIRIMVWLPRTPTGDRAELNLMPGEQTVWSQICAQPDTCTPSRCPRSRKGTCFLHRVRSRAAGSHLIVVNHALLLADLASENKVLPGYDHLIVDEAHHLEEEATDQLGFQIDRDQILAHLAGLSQPVGGGRWIGFLTEVRGHLPKAGVAPAVQRDVDAMVEGLHGAVERTRQRVAEFFGAVATFAGHHIQEVGDYERRLRLTPSVRSQPDWTEVEINWENLNLALQGLEDGLGRLCVAFEGLSSARVVDYDEFMNDLAAHLGRNADLRGRLAALVATPSSNEVYWLTAGSTGSVSLCAAPLHVGEVLSKALFEAKQSVVLTSATLTAEHSFDYICERLGIPEAETLRVGSPFDFERSTLIYTASDLPEPGRPGYQRQLEQALIELCRATHGRALVLFTSRSAVRNTHQAIRPALERDGILVLGHGVDGSRKQLLKTFKSNPKTVLLGTTSFWEGVDVVGEALSVLVIAKLPFSVPTDPVFAARAELFEDAFHQYAVPQAVIRFKQGFGRLIRSKTDRGVVVIFDRRVLTKSYGAAFLQSLPPCSRQNGPAANAALAAARWLEKTDEGRRTIDDRRWTTDDGRRTTDDRR